MADTDKTTLKKLGTLLEKLREVQAQTYDLAEEMQRLLAGEPGIGARLKVVEAGFSDLWEGRYHAPYVFNFLRDRPQIKRLLKSATPDAILDRALRYIKSNDPFYAEKRHPFGLFVSSWNSWAQAAESPDDFDLEAPADCNHSPRCASDAIHTRRKSAELRA